MLHFTGLRVPLAWTRSRSGKNSSSLAYSTLFHNAIVTFQDGTLRGAFATIEQGRSLPDTRSFEDWRPKGQCHSNKERGRQKGDFLVEIRKTSFSTERHLSNDI